MPHRNRFIKLLTIPVRDKELLLYGFSVPTKQELYPWKKKPDKRTFNIHSAILSEEEAKRFEQSLTGNEDIPLNGVALSAPGLFSRKPVLSYSIDWKTQAPVSGLSLVCEFWNTEKEELIKELKSAFASQGKTLYRNMQSLLIQLQEECGVSFSQHGSRFGNYERYEDPSLYCPLDIHCEKVSEGNRILVQKPADWTKPLVINCSVRHLERVLFNQIRFLKSEDIQMEFFAAEPIDWCTLSAWDQETGELVFFKSFSPINQLILTINLSETRRSVRDPWTESLNSAARNRSNLIRDEIESVQRRSSERSICIGNKDPFSVSAQAGEQLLSLYKAKSCRGAFIPKEQKDGEIDSFLKIQEYLEQGDVCCAVIADPYFSIPTAAKILSRIKNTGLELIVITSLADTDPDTEEKKSNVAERYQKFLQNNALILHRKLCIYNLYRGKERVFHDRYLIRYHADGHIDGFLLSNSLNSMGQFYPFVIAPLDTEVCLSVAEYLNQLQDMEFQKTQPKKERISCQILHDYRDKQHVQSPPPAISAGRTWLAQWPDQNIPADALPTALGSIVCHFEEQPDEVCRMLCFLGGHTYLWSAEDLAVLLRQEQPAMIDPYIAWFSAQVQKLESTRNRQGRASNPQEHILWSLLAGKAVPDRMGFKQLLECPDPIHYREYSWMTGGSYLLLTLDPVRFTSLMAETCSPLMLSCLTKRLSMGPWSESLYHCLLNCKNFCIRLLAAHWPIHLLEQDGEKGLTFQTILPLLDSLAPDFRLLQSTRLLSEAAFYIRNPKRASNHWPALLPVLIDYAAAVLPLCTPEAQQTGLHWLYDCEECSLCSLYLMVASKLDDSLIQNHLLDAALDVMQKYLTAPHYDHDITRHIALCLDALEARFSTQAEQELHKRFINWDVFETAAEPARRDYDYRGWHSANLRARWQIQLLHAFLSRNPQAKRTQNYLKLWEKRIDSAADYKL